MKCGEICLIAYPFTDLSGSKVRPALVVSADLYNCGDDLVFLPISSAPDASDPCVYPLERTHPAFAAARLKTDSYIKWSKPMALSGRIVQRRLGELDKPTLEAVQALVRQLFT